MHCHFNKDTKKRSYIQALSRYRLFHPHHGYICTLSKGIHEQNKKYEKSYHYLQNLNLTSKVIHWSEDGCSLITKLQGIPLCPNPLGNHWHRAAENRTEQAFEQCHITAKAGSDVCHSLKRKQKGTSMINVSVTQRIIMHITNAEIQLHCRG